jgi:predicted  nucleic acid-binding Zn-ribbon protein
MRFTLAPLALFAAVLTTPAHAQTLPEVKASLSSILGEIERNLADKEAIEMNFKDWQSRNASFEPRLDEYNRRIDEENAYCQGTFEHDEYVRRKAACDSVYAQLDTLKAQLEPERLNLEEELHRLQARDAERSKAGDAIQARFAEGLKQLTFACALLSNEEYAQSCRIEAAGPRTAPMVERINAALAGHAL